MSNKSLLEQVLLSLGSSDYALIPIWDGSNGLHSLQHIIASLPVGATRAENLRVEVSSDVLSGFDMLLGAVQKSFADHDKAMGTDVGSEMHAPHATTLFHSSSGNRSETLIGMLGDDTQHNWTIQIMGAPSKSDVGRAYVQMNVCLHLTPDNVRTKIQNLKTDWVSRHTQNFHRSLMKIKEKMPASMQDQVIEQVMDEFKGLELFHPILATRDRKDLEAEVRTEAPNKSPPKM